MNFKTCRKVKSWEVMEENESSSDTDDIVLESLPVSDDASVIVLDSDEKEEGAGTDDDDCVVLEHNFNCLRIPPLEVEEKLPKCDTWEEFLVEEELMVVSRKADLEQDSTSFGVSIGLENSDLGDPDVNDNILASDSPKNRKRKKEKNKKSRSREGDDVGEDIGSGGTKSKSKKHKSGRDGKSRERQNSVERDKPAAKKKSERPISRKEEKPREHIRKSTGNEVDNNLSENNFVNKVAPTPIENAQEQRQRVSREMDVSLSHQLAISSEEEEEEEENLTGEAAGEYWMRLATAGAPQDDGGGEGGQGDRKGGDDGGHQAGDDLSCEVATREDQKGSKGDDEISFECQENDLFSEDEEETDAEQANLVRDEQPVDEEVGRGQDTGIDVFSLGEYLI